MKKNHLETPGNHLWAYLNLSSNSRIVSICCIINHCWTQKSPLTMWLTTILSHIQMQIRLYIYVEMCMQWQHTFYYFPRKKSQNLHKYVCKQIFRISLKLLYIFFIKINKKLMKGVQVFPYFRILFVSKRGEKVFHKTQ